MNSNDNSVVTREVLSDELDIKKLFITLWQRKLIIIGITAFFAIATYVISTFMTPVWTSSAILKKPSLAQLGNFPRSEQIIQSLDVIQTINEPTGLTDIIYKEFIQVLGSYDFKRQFWLASDYYSAKSALLTTDHEKAVLLENLINDIQFTAKDERKGTLDTINLKADTSLESAELLRKYINDANLFVINKIVNELNQIKLENLTRYQNEQEKLIQSLASNKQDEINKLQTQKQDLKAQLDKLKGLADSSQNDIEYLESTIAFIDEQLTYSQIIADPDIRLEDWAFKIKELQAIPEITGFEKAFEFLKTPQQPIKADSPRKTFWAFLAALVGGFIGVCVALIQGPKSIKQKTA